MPETHFILSAGVVLILGAMLQSAVGFGFGMFAIPLLLLMGAEPYEAIVILSICGTVQTLIGMWSLRAHIAWRRALQLIALAGLMLPLGVWTLWAIDTHVSKETIRQIFGGIVLVVLLTQMIARVKPRDHLHWGWGALATSLCGCMSGLSGMGGPPLVMWVMAHTWSTDRSRVMLYTVFTGLTPFQIGAMCYTFGPRVIDAVGVGAAVTPFALIGIIPGLWIGKRIPKPKLRIASYIVLLLVSLYAILEPILHG
jgi:uncharacterized membrane protein YfcA